MQGSGGCAYSSHFLQPNNTRNVTYNIQCWLVTIHYYQRWVQKCTSGAWPIIRFYVTKFL